MSRMRILSFVASAALGGAAMCTVGCHGSTETPASTPATQPNAMMPMGGQGKPPEPPVSLKKPDPASMTHLLTKDEPYYESMPGADAKSPGMLSKGSKVLVLVPGSTYSKVLTDQGTEVYTVTDGLDPISKK